ncbi:MAG: LysM peptidoglycan-binding domain-containing protein, partial [Armatimonadetes bacterium]|nr:LysM peptidoglycan-binding domain-containing protein [Armatimonadota bacterium]
IAGLVLLYLGALPGGRRVCLVTVDGDPVTVVETRADAERILDEIRSEADLRPEEIKFAQEVKLHNVSAMRNPVQSDTEAIEALRSRLEIVAPAAAILADGELIIALPDQSEAVRTLSLLLTKLAPPGPNTTVYFSERVKIQAQDVAPDLLVHSADEAAERIADQASSTTEHEIKPGESAWQIARDHEVTLPRLAHANPEVDLEKLQAGAKLRIPGKLPSITVIARKEIEEEVGQGRSGRTRKVRITYENGMEVKRDTIGGRLPVPSARPRPASEPWRWRDEVTQ